MSRKVQFTNIPVLRSETTMPVIKFSKTPTKVKDKTFKAIRKRAEDYVRFMTVIVTGARPNEIVIGTKTQSKDAVVKIHDKLIPPWKQELDHIRAYKDMWIKFLNKLASIEFFGSLSIQQREEWLAENQNTSKTYMDEIPGVKFEVLQLGKSDLRTKLSEEDIESLLSGEIIPATEIRDMFPRKPGSKAKRTTMMFRRSIWKVSLTHREVQTFDGPTFNLATGLITSSAKTRKSNEVILVLERFGGVKPYDVGFLTTRKGIALDEATILPYVLRRHPGFTIEDIDIIKQATYTFTPAAYKSLLQKIIRFRPKVVDFGKDFGIYPANFALSVTLALLVIMPGSFVPDIQRYVTGMESAFKRLAVTVFEDSSVDNKHHSTLLRMVCAAILAQRVKSWRPDEDLIETLFMLGDIAWNQDAAYYYNINRGIDLPPYYVDTNGTLLGNTSALMDELRSFQSDLGMIRDIAKEWSENAGESPRDRNPTMPDVMPLLHCVDQHWAPEVVYFYPYEVVKDKYTPGSRPYSQLVRDIFSITGVNPRRTLGKKGRVMHPKTYSPDLEDRLFTKQTREAQRLLLVSRQSPREQTIPALKKNISFDYEIDEDWLAGLVGTLEISGRPAALATLDPRNISEYIVFRKPAREMKSASLTDKQTKTATTKLITQLKNGIKLTGATPPVEKLMGSKVILRGENYYIQPTSDEEMLWDDFRRGQETFTLFKIRDLSVDRALTTYVTGIAIEADSSLEKLLEEVENDIVRRLLFYINRNSSAIEFNHVSREGGGTKDAVMIEDVGAYQLLLKISLLYPSAIQRRTGITLIFDVKFAPLLWGIRNLVETYLARDVPIHTETWTAFRDHKNRELFWYQEEGLSKMFAEHTSGLKAHFLYMTVGAGKTLTVLTYLQYLQQRDELPPYVLYALPSSAFKSVIGEIEAFKLNINILVPLKSIPKDYDKDMRKYASKNCDMKPYMINMIEHDHLRECGDTLAVKMSQSVFIFDEAHKALNDSIRTSVALNLSSLAQDTVALTGTPIIDTKTYKLIRWLERIVEFEVNEKNYWVATGAMIKYIVNTNIPVIEESVLSTFTPEEETVYQNLVPPNLGGKNTNHKQADIRKATEICYKACTREMVQQTKKYLAQDRGVFVVARTTDHQYQLKKKILKEIPDLEEEDVFIIGKSKSLLLTKEAVAKGKVRDYRVVITTIRHSEGYTLTTLSVMVTSVYPSNNATREQIAGRINRPGQYAEDLVYVTVHAGILTYILEHHNDAKNLSSVLKTISEQIYSS